MYIHMCIYIYVCVYIYTHVYDFRCMHMTTYAYHAKTDGDIEVINFTKYMPYILDLTCYRYEFEKYRYVIKGYTISKINKTY